MSINPPEQQPQYQQPVYSAPPVYLAVPAPPRGKSVTSMILGIISVLFGFLLVLPIIGFILGLTGLKTEPAGRGMAITGIVLNGIMLLVWVVGGLFIILAIIASIAATNATTTY